MDLFKITIEGKDYEYLDSKNINGKDYVLYTDGNQDFISEYVFVNGSINLIKIDDSTIELIRKEFNI